MKKEKTTDLINRLEARVEEHISIAVRVFQNLNPEALLKPSSSDGWSIAQCLWHLNSYGDFYLPQIQKALGKKGNAEVKEDFKSGWFGAYFTKMMQPESGSKMKAFKGHTPSPDLDGPAVVAEFIQQQEMLLKYLSESRNANLDVRVPISITKLIKLKLGDVFQFNIAHDERHIQQAKRNLHTP